MVVQWVFFAPLQLQGPLIQSSTWVTVCMDFLHENCMFPPGSLLSFFLFLRNMLVGGLLICAKVLMKV